MGKRTETLETMKSFLFFFSLILITYKETTSSPAPKPDNDVHFHVNMPGSESSYPLKTGGKNDGADYAEYSGADYAGAVRNCKGKKNGIYCRTAFRIGCAFGRGRTCQDGYCSCK